MKKKKKEKNPLEGTDLFTYEKIERKIKMEIYNIQYTCRSFEVLSGRKLNKQRPNLFSLKKKYRQNGVMPKSELTHEDV